MVLKMDQRCAYAAKPFVPDLISQPWIGLSSKASDRLWFRREDKNRVESHLTSEGGRIFCLCETNWTSGAQFYYTPLHETATFL